MADAAPLLPGLPDEIAIWEILVRLPPKPLLRCRAVSRSWRRATSARDFLLRHHARQPALPLFCSRDDLADGGRSLDIVPFDHRAGVAAGARFQSVARLKTPPYQAGLPFFNLLLHLEASRDGLLLLSNSTLPCICNPATRQYAPLHHLDGLGLLELYPHPPTGEHRLLLHRPAQDQRALYVFTIGSDQPPRRIGCAGPNGILEHILGLLFQGSIHWYTQNAITVFDTTDESFGQIRAPVAACDYARLFEMGDMLGIFLTNDEDTTVDIWVMRDYQGEAWDFMRRVELPVAEIRQRCQSSCHEEGVIVLVPGDGELLVLVSCNGWLFQVDVDGKLVASFQPRDLNPTHYVLKQTLVQHTFFPTLEGYVVNALPFI